MYDGGSRKPWGRGEGVMETWQNGPRFCKLLKGSGLRREFYNMSQTEDYSAKLILLDFYIGEMAG